MTTPLENRFNNKRIEDTYKSAHHAFENTDDPKGRRVGAMVHTWQVEWFNVPEGKSYYIGRRGDFVLRVHATRNGQPYGAWQREQFFDTEEARNSAIDKYLAGAFKRAIKRR